MKRFALIGHMFFAHPVLRLLFVGLAVINATIAGGGLHGLSVLLLAFCYECLMLSRRDV